MKKTIILLGLMAMILCLSCKKEEVIPDDPYRCYECEILIQVEPYNFFKLYKTKDFCGTIEEKNAFEQKNTYQTHLPNQIDTNKVTKCKLKNGE